MARARLEDLQRQLQRREWENESTSQNVDEDSKTARTHRRRKARVTWSDPECQMMETPSNENPETNMTSAALGKKIFL